MRANKSPERPTGYEPLFVPKVVAPGVWIVDGPAISFYGLPFPTRMTVVRLESGDLFVHSPIDPGPDQALFEAVAALGAVRHLVSPNWIHYAFIDTWKRRFPDALAWSSPGVEARASSRGHALSFDRSLARDAPPWINEIEQLVVPGSRVHTEVVFFHRASRTLILTDLIENFELHKSPRWVRPLLRLAGNCDPDGKAPIDMRMSFSGGREQARAAVETMIAWAPERVLLAHGRWYPSEGVKELRRAFRWLLGRG